MTDFTKLLLSLVDVGQELERLSIGAGAMYEVDLGRGVRKPVEHLVKPELEALVRRYARRSDLAVQRWHRTKSIRSIQTAIKWLLLAKMFQRRLERRTRRPAKR